MTWRSQSNRSPSSLTNSDAEASGRRSGREQTLLIRNIKLGRLQVQRLEEYVKVEQGRNLEINPRGSAGMSCMNKAYLVI